MNFSISDLFLGLKDENENIRINSDETLQSLILNDTDLLIEFIINSFNEENIDSYIIKLGLILILKISINQKYIESLQFSLLNLFKYNNEEIKTNCIYTLSIIGFLEYKNQNYKLINILFDNIHENIYSKESISCLFFIIQYLSIENFDFF